MAFLDYMDCAKDYMNDLCNDICDIVTKFYPGTPTKAGEDGAESDIAFVYLKKASDRPKDDVRRANELLCNEFTSVSEEHKRLKVVVDQISREYEESKDVDFFRRYGILKGMIKRCVLHLKLRNDDHNQAQYTCGKQKEEMRKREEHITGLTTQEITQENDEIQDQIREYRRKISMIRDLIEELERNYEASKRYIVIQRYRLMKNMIKHVIHNNWI